MVSDLHWFSLSIGYGLRELNFLKTKIPLSIGRNGGDRCDFFLCLMLNPAQPSQILCHQSTKETDIIFATVRTSR
jgi:hypothetical protein